MSPSEQPRLAVAKTHKLFIGGAFPRSESGRTYVVTDSSGAFLANVARASGKDLRDAVSAARKAAPGWAAATAYNRGQVLYRMAEVLESRSHDIASAVSAAEGSDQSAALRQVAAAVDRLVWYAGWTDKVVQVFGNANPVAGPYFNVSTPEPLGIVGVLAPQDSSLLGLISVVAPPLAAGSVVVAVAAQASPIPAVLLAEVAATSDVPGGVVNLLTGHADELGPHLASHGDVDGLDLAGASAEALADLRVAAARTTTRLIAASTRRAHDWTAEPTAARLRDAMEVKTVWHPAGT